MTRPIHKALDMAVDCSQTREHHMKSFSAYAAMSSVPLFGSKVKYIISCYFLHFMCYLHKIHVINRPVY
jgi:hypothetical protein